MRQFFISGVSVTIPVAAIALALCDDKTPGPPEESAEASDIADAWWFEGVDTSSANDSSQRTCAGPVDGTFFACTGTIMNRGSYEDAWNFYAKKCGADETYSESPRIVGQPTSKNGYYTIFQRTDGGRHTTTFASHEKDATVTVHLHEIEATSENTTLQLSVVVVQR